MYRTQIERIRNAFREALLYLMFLFPSLAVGLARYGYAPAFDLAAQNRVGDTAAIEIKILGLVIVVVVIVVFAGSVFISLWADSSGYSGIGIQIAQAIAAIPIAIGQGIANLITHYLNPANW